MTNAEKSPGEFPLDPSLDFLNHGSFGSCPRPVTEEAAAWRARFEHEPISFVLEDFEPALDRSRAEVSAFVGADPLDLVFVTSPTVGVGAILASFPFEPGDEVLITNHTYNACKNAALYWTERARARVVVAGVPFPVADEDTIVDAVLAAVTPRTRLALIDHVTSPTALVFPVAELTRALRERAVDVLIDGAHAPGMLDLDIASLGADYYVGALHKWVGAPKGASILWARRELQPRLHPLVISHGYRSSRRDRPAFWLEFDWTGTFDPSALLAAPAAIRYLGQLLPGGWPELRSRNHALVTGARAVIATRLGLSLPCPDRMLGSMATLFLPDDPAPEARPGWPFAEPLHRNLLLRHRIQVPVSPWPASPSRLLRISAQIYNHPAQYERLANALAAELGAALRAPSGAHG